MNIKMPQPAVSLREGLVYIEATDLRGSQVAIALFPPTARDFGNDLLAEAEIALRESPAVQRLTEDLEELDQGDLTWEDFALELIRKGYHK